MRSDTIPSSPALFSVTEVRDIFIEPEKVTAYGDTDGNYVDEGASVMFDMRAPLIPNFTIAGRASDAVTGEI